MSTLTDVQALYGSMQNARTKSQAHVISHFFLILVVFAIFGVTIPDVAIASINPKQISSSEWFKIAKDTGII